MILRLEKDQEIVQSLIEHCEKNKIVSAWITGIGAISEAQVALYDLNKKEYFRKTLPGPLEIISLIGNIGTMDNKTVTHLHIALGNKDFEVFGGHLDKAIVAATCELRIEPLDTQIIREYNEEIGLNLIQN